MCCDLTSGLHLFYVVLQCGRGDSLVKSRLLEVSDRLRGLTLLASLLCSQYSQ